MVSKKDRKKQLDSKLRELIGLTKREKRRRKQEQTELMKKMNGFEEDR